MSGTTNCSPCTDCTTPSTPVTCAQPSYTANTCPETFASDCTYYTGPDQDCLGISSSGTPITLTSVLIAIFTYLSTILNRITSSSLSVISPSSCAGTVAVELIPSSQSGNILVLGTDGKPYVPQTLVSMQSSKCISWQSTGQPGAITWVPVLDFGCISTAVAAAAIQCTAPTSVVISGITINGATIAFGTIGGLTYNILVNNTVVATNVASPYVITGLDANTNYSVTVQVECQNGASSDTVTTFTTSAILSCNMPSGLQISSQ